MGVRVGYAAARQAAGAGGAHGDGVVGLPDHGDGLGVAHDGQGGRGGGEQVLLGLAEQARRPGAVGLVVVRGHHDDAVRDAVVVADVLGPLGGLVGVAGTVEQQPRHEVAPDLARGRREHAVASGEHPDDRRGVLGDQQQDVVAGQRRGAVTGGGVLLGDEERGDLAPEQHRRHDLDACAGPGDPQRPPGRGGGLEGAGPGRPGADAGRGLRDAEARGRGGEHLAGRADHGREHAELARHHGRDGLGVRRRRGDEPGEPTVERDEAARAGGVPARRVHRRPDLPRRHARHPAPSRPGARRARAARHDRGPTPTREAP